MLRASATWFITGFPGTVTTGPMCTMAAVGTQLFGRAIGGGSLAVFIWGSWFHR